MFIKDIEPIKDAGINLLEEQNPDEIIDKIVELPLRKPCKLLRQKGIQTVMSSANRNNVLQSGEKRKEKEDLKNGWLYFKTPKIEVINCESSWSKSAQDNNKCVREGKWELSDSTTSFEDAGCGYAWIMLDFDTLSDENKDLLFDLEERKDAEGNPIGEKGIWFVHPFMMGNIDYQLRSGKLDFEDIKGFLEEHEIASLGKIKKDDRLEKFENKSIILSYNNRYPTQTVMIRMPVTEQTTVQEVEEYFVKFAEVLKERNKEKELEDEQK